MMRVLTVGPLPPPPGGMATVVANLDQALSEHLAHRVLNNAKTTSADRSLFEAIASQLTLLIRYVLIMLSWRPRVVHIHTCSDFTFWRNSVDVLLAWLLLRRVVLHIHGGRFARFLGGLSPAKAAMARWVFRRCGGVVVLGPVWEELMRDWVGDTPITVVPNGVSVPDSPVTVEGSARIICVAGIEKGKGQRELIEALLPLKDLDWQLQLVGQTVQVDYQQALVELCEVEGIAARVVFTGALPPAEKDERLAASNLFVLASHDEALPMSMLEAMAMGVPVVMTDVGSVADVVNPGVNGLLVPARDVPALSSAIETFIRAPEQRLELGLGGRETVESAFGIRVCAQRLQALYQDLSH